MLKTIGCLVYLFATSLPFIVIDIPVLAKLAWIVFGIIVYRTFRISCINSLFTIGEWVWGFICALKAPTEILSIIYFVVFALFVIFYLFPPVLEGVLGIIYYISSKRE